MKKEPDEIYNTVAPLTFLAITIVLIVSQFL